MSKSDLEKLLPLFIYGELSKEEQRWVEEALSADETLRERYRELLDLQKTLNLAVELEPTDKLLEQSRLRLRVRLRTERSRQTGVISVVSSWLGRLNIRLWTVRLTGAAAFLFLGFIIGRYFFLPELNYSAGEELASNRQLEDAGNELISEVDYIRHEPNSGDVTIHYKTLRDETVHGSLNDPEVRRLLGHAIISESNPGRRLTAVRATAGTIFADPQLEDALIHAMEKDSIDGVRLRAVKALNNLPLSQNIQKAFIRVLTSDPNPAMRIAALNALDDVEQKSELVHVLREAFKKDDNEFVRLKASKTLEKVQGGPE